MSVLHRNNVHIRGRGRRTIVFAPSFGADQAMWRFVAPSFEHKFSTVLFDHVGTGRSDFTAYSSGKYATLDGYANDVLEICRELDLKNAIFVGHSSSAMIGPLISAKAPGVFSELVLVAASPRFIDEPEYIGGFTAMDIEDMLKAIDDDHIGWATRMAPLVVGNVNTQALERELVDSISRNEPSVLKESARAFLHCDSRKNLSSVTARSLIMQCRDDIMAPMAVGKYLHGQLSNSELIFMRSRGHFPHLSAAEDTVAAIRDFISTSEKSRTPVPNSVNDAPGEVDRSRRERRISARLARDRQFLEDSLLRRVGELRMHLGRYDMYAVALERRLVGPAIDDFGGSLHTIASRGEAIIRLMQRRGIAPEFHEQFRAIDDDLRHVLTRQVIAPHNPAVLVSMGLARVGHVKNPNSAARDWYDQDNASDDEIRAFTDDMDRDILKVVSLYVRLANCASAMERERKP